MPCQGVYESKTRPFYRFCSFWSKYKSRNSGTVTMLNHFQCVTYLASFSFYPHKNTLQMLNDTCVYIPHAHSAFCILECASYVIFLSFDHQRRRPCVDYFHCKSPSAPMFSLHKELYIFQ